MYKLADIKFVEIPTDCDPDCAATSTTQQEDNQMQEKNFLAVVLTVSIASTKRRNTISANRFRLNRANSPLTFLVSCAFCASRTILRPFRKRNLSLLIPTKIKCPKQEADTYYDLYKLYLKKT